MSALVVTIYFLSFALSFAIGANDAANALATSYGSEAAPLLFLLICGSIFEFLGAFFCSGTVAAKLAYRMIPGLDSAEPYPMTQDQIMFSVSLAGFLFIACASFTGMPISGTHTIVGALIGAGVCGLGSQAISYDYLRRVIISWFVSPAVSSSLCFIFIVIVSFFTLNGGGFSLKARLINLQIVSGLTFSIMLYMTLILVQKNYTAADEPIIDLWQYGLFPVAWVLGFLTSRFYMAHVCIKDATFSQKLVFALKCCSFTEIETFVNKSQAIRIDFAGERHSENSRSTKPMSKVPGMYLVTEEYRFLMVAAAMLVCLAHGSNDVANAITPLLVV